jgi:uncharacterized protein
MKPNSKRKTWKTRGITIALTTTVLFLNYWIPENLLPYMLLSHQNFPVEDQPKILTATKAETLKITSPDNIPTEGWWIPTATPNDSPTLIILHNLGGTRQDNLTRFLPLAQQNINLLFLDLREHGKSGGEFFTYGYHEWQDIKAAIDHLEKTTILPHITILGISAGGTVALSAAAHDPRIKGVITIGTFADLTQTINQQTSWLPNHWRATAMKKAEQLAKFEIAATSPVKNIASLIIPTLIIHGQNDTYIPFTNAQQLFAAAHEPKQLYTIKNANHSDMLDKGGEELLRAIATFTK